MPVSLGGIEDASYIRGGQLKYFPQKTESPLVGGSAASEFATYLNWRVSNLVESSKGVKRPDQI